MKLKHLNRLMTLFAVLWALLLNCTRLAAQTQTTGDVTGVVTDASGAVMPGAKVVLKSNDRGTAQDITTSKDGVYRFFLLAPGSYTVTVSAVGFKPRSNRGHQLGSNRHADIHLSVGSSSSTVTATEKNPSLNPKMETSPVPCLKSKFRRCPIRVTHHVQRVIGLYRLQHRRRGPRKFLQLRHFRHRQSFYDEWHGR